MPVIRQLAKFNVVGMLNTLIDFGIFFLLTALNTPYLYAQTISYSCGIANSYIWNKYWTFESAGLNLPEMVRFLSVNLASLASSVLLIYLLHSLADLPLLPAKIGATLVVMVVGFVGNKLWVFRLDSPPTGS